MASSSSSSSSISNTGASLSAPNSQQTPWAPGVSPRSLEHQRNVGFVYNEDHEEYLFNLPADLPGQAELEYHLDMRLDE